MPDPVPVAMRVNFEVADLLARGDGKTLVAGGIIQAIPHQADPAGIEEGISDGLDRHRVINVVWRGSLWKPAERPYGGDFIPGMTPFPVDLLPGAIGLESLDGRHVDIDINNPRGPACYGNLWEEEGRRISQMLADNVMRCGDDLYVKSPVPRIRVQWPRTAGSKPRAWVSDRPNEADTSSATYFSILRCEDVNRFVGMNRETGDRPLQVRIPPAARACLPETSDIADFASATASWFAARLGADDESHPYRAGYGLLPSDVLVDAEMVRRSAGGPIDVPEALLDTVRRIHMRLSDREIGRLCRTLRDLQASEAAVVSANNLAVRFARMTRLAACRWDFECALHGRTPSSDGSGCLTAEEAGYLAGLAS